MQADQRVVELEFLAGLARQGGYREMSALAHEQAGTTGPLFKDLLLTLLLENCLTGAEPGAPPAIHVELHARDPREHLWRTNGPTVHQVLGNRFPYMVRITHLGLIRLARLREELDRARVLDPTGILVDRRYVERDLRIRLAMLREGARLSLVAADLDGFKRVNDHLGHSEGDEALRRYFSVLRDLTSAADGDAYRHGGDETLAILPGMEAQAAVELAESLRRGVGTELAYLDKKLERTPTVSAGVLTLRGPREVLAILKHVDQLLYRAKEEGRNRVVAETG